MPENPVLRIQTLGGFSVSVDGVTLSDNSARAGQVWKLFKFIITNRANPIPTDKIIDALWGEDEACDNPIKALYSLMYRLRALLNKPFAQKQAFILFQHNCYIWNARAPFWLDADQFEALCRRAGDVALPEPERIALYRQAFDLYPGDYLAESSQEIGALPPVNYYKRLYTQVVHELSALCEAAGDWASVVHICERAIELDPYEETHHIALIRALIQLGQLSQALAHYDYITSVLYKELGVSPSDRLQELYKQIRSHSEDVLYDINTIEATLDETEGSPGGAFFCEAETFRRIYQLEKRAMARSGLSAYLCSLSLTTPQHRVPPADVLGDCLPRLKDVVVSGLRRGDVVTQYSKSQLLLILSSTSFEDCERVLQRLQAAFCRGYKGPPVAIQPSIKLMRPTG